VFNWAEMYYASGGLKRQHSSHSDTVSQLFNEFVLLAVREICWECAGMENYQQLPCTCPSSQQSDRQIRKYDDADCVGGNY